MSIAYFNCASGAAGDMILGAILSAGLPFSHLQKELKKLSLTGYALRNKKENRQKVLGANFQVHVERPFPNPTEERLHSTIERSSLAPAVKSLSRKILHQILQTQRKVFEIPANALYFDGKEAMDVLVDVVGAAVGFDFFRFKEIFASPLPFHRCYSDDVVEALKGIPLEKSQTPHRLVTITGASILKTVVKHFGESPLSRIEKSGAGLGDMELFGQPNALKLTIGEGFLTVVCEANIDDMNPQWFDYCMEKLLALGVVDVSLLPIQMKKNRPGVLLKVLCPWDLKEKAMEIILKETTTLGVRYYPVERKILTRELKTVETRFGKLPVKFAKDGDAQIEKWIPEYDACRKIAQARKIPLRKVYEEVLKNLQSSH